MPQPAKSSAVPLSVQRSEDELRLALAGEWRVSELAAIDRVFLSIDLGGVRHVRIDTSQLVLLDFSAAWRLRDFLERVRQLDGQIVFEGGSEPEQLRLITDCLARAPYRPPAANDEGASSRSTHWAGRSCAAGVTSWLHWISPAASS